MATTDRVIKLILIACLLFAIVMQFKIVYMVNENKEALDADPLVVGAQKFNIPYCACSVSDNVQIVFNQTVSKTVLFKKGVNIGPIINITWDSKKSSP